MPITETATPDDYHLLGLQPGASPEDVKRAYRELAKKWHPDRYTDGPEWARLRAEEKFKDLQEAYRRILIRPMPGRAEKDTAVPKKEPSTAPVDDAQPRRTRKPRAAGNLPANPFRSLGKWAAAGAVVALVALWAFWATDQRGQKASVPISAGAPKGGAIPRQAFPEASGLPARVEEVLSFPRTPAIHDLEASGGGRLRMAPPALPVERFTLGSSERDVLRVQGPPDRRSGGRWVYGLSEVRFQDGRVVGYDNFDGRLRVVLRPSEKSGTGGPPGDFFTLGSTKDDVVRVQGTPTGVRGPVWHYGFSSVRFFEDRVVDFDNSFGNLKIRLLPSPEYLAKTGGVAPSFFTIGSSADEVLAVQGTPSRVRGNMWFYGFSDVLFRDGRVGWVNDPGAQLRFVDKEALSERSAADRK